MLGELIMLSFLVSRKRDDDLILQSDWTPSKIHRLHQRRTFNWLKPSGVLKAQSMRHSDTTSKTQAHIAPLSPDYFSTPKSTIAMTMTMERSRRRAK